MIVSNSVIFIVFLILLFVICFTWWQKQWRGEWLGEGWDGLRFKTISTFSKLHFANSRFVINNIVVDLLEHHYYRKKMQLIAKQCGVAMISRVFDWLSGIS